MADQKTILVVDDESDIRFTLTKILESENYNVIQAKNGQEALDIIDDEKNVISLIMLDIMMDKVNGYEFIKRLDKIKRKNLYIIMLTAMATNDNIMKGYVEGADYYITKPFKSETVTNIVSYLIGDLTDDKKREVELLL